MKWGDLATALAWTSILFMSTTYGHFPHHDTFHGMEVFDYVYRQLFNYSSFPLWLPNVNFGVPSRFDLMVGMTPSRLLAALAGVMTGVRSSALLFDVAMLIDHLVLVVGVWLLARRLFARRETVILVTLAGTFLGFPWIFQDVFNIHLVYGLPLALHQIVIFFDNLRTRHLWSTAIILSLSLIGTAGYVAPIHLLVCGTVFLTLMVGRRLWPWRWARPAWPDWVALAVAVVLGGLVISLFLGWKGDVDSLHTGRVHDDVGLGLFLTYGDPLVRFGRWANMVTGVRFWDAEVNAYIGWLPLIGMLWAALRVRTLPFFAFGLATLVILGFANGGAVSVLSYYLVPGMKFFRHVAYVGAPACLLIVLCAGFGFDAVFAALTAPRRAAGGLTAADSAIVAAGAAYGLDTLLSAEFHTVVSGMAGPKAAIAASLVAIRFIVYAMALARAGYLLAKGRLRAEKLAIIAGMVLLLDLGGNVVGYMLELPPESAANRMASRFLWDSPRPIPYIPTRRRPDALLKVLGGAPAEFPKNTRFPDADTGATTVLGCNTPKLRLLAAAALPASLTEAALAVRVADLSRVVVLRPDTSQALDGVLFTASPADAAALVNHRDDTVWTEGAGPVDIHLADEVALHGYRLTATAAETMPTAWRIEGSADGRAWTVLDERHGAAWQASERRDFEFASPARVRQLRLTILHDHAGIAPAQVAGFDPIPALPAAGDPVAGSVRVTGFNANRLEAEVQVDGAGPVWLVYADAFSPDWVATVDGHPAKLFEADLATKAVSIPSGRHRVAFAYRPAWRWQYLAMLIAAAAGLIVVVWINRPASGLSAAANDH